MKDLRLGERLTLPLALREFFREPVTVRRAQEEIRRALAGREEQFLDLARSRIYGRPASPYLRLLRLAGCDFSDLRAHVRQHGLEETLHRLAGEGVYLTSDEVKGKRDVVRGGTGFRVSPQALRRQDASAGFLAVSSGTRNQPARSFIPVDWLAVRTWAAAVFFQAHDLFSHSHAIYDGILPASAGINNLLIYAKLAKPADRWFARRIPVGSRLEGAFHSLITSLIVFAAGRFGPGVPGPDFVTIEEVARIVRWVEAESRAGTPCCITTAASNAARIARRAWDMGVSLAGTKFIVTGEPFTEAKREVLARVGAAGASRYAYGGGLNVGFGCAAPRQIDEIHVNEHLLALVPHPRPLSDDGPPIHPLLCTTVHPLAPTLLLNVENGDFAAMERRACGCALGEVGLGLHLSGIRSFEKFTSEGMNYFYLDLFQLLEKALPSEFGGGPGDYQLVEEEDSGGQTRLTLLVDPKVGGLDEDKLSARLREALVDGSRGNRFMARVWQDSGTLRIRRQAPHGSPRGKILPLHFSQGRSA